METDYTVIEARDTIKSRTENIIKKLFEELYIIRYFVCETKPKEYELSEREWRDIVNSNKGYLVEWYHGRRNPPHIMGVGTVRNIVADFVNVADVVLSEDEQKRKISSEEATRRMDDLINVYKTAANEMGYSVDLEAAKRRVLYGMVNRFMGVF